jgi:hypothetical protein
MIVGLLVEMVAAMLLIVCWLVIDMPTQRKVVWTVFYAATWLPIVLSSALHVSAQGIFAACICFKMFGPSQ